MNVLLTGSSGFIGHRLSERIKISNELSMTCAVRRPASSVCDREVVIEALDSKTDWSTALVDQDVVIHTAARAHVMDDSIDNPLEEYRKVNVEGTLALAQQAVRAGVKRFIFLSSIKVNGELTSSTLPFRMDDKPAPKDCYGVSKLEAEVGLRELAIKTGMELVIIRPTLVYGPGVKGNFASLLKLVKRGIPLPLGAVNNKRSLVAIDNLVDLIVTCVLHPSAAGQTFIASDDHDLSTTELLTLMYKAAAKQPRLIPLPASLLTFGASLLGKKTIADRLLGSLQVDINHTKETLSWVPPISVEQGIQRCFQQGE